MENTDTLNPAWKDVFRNVNLERKQWSTSTGVLWREIF